MKTNHVKWGLALVVAMAILIPGLASTAQADERYYRSNENSYNGHSAYSKHRYHNHQYQQREYQTYRNHRGYWEQRNGAQFFIRIN